MPNIEILLSRLRKVRKVKPSNWVACCPAHDDRAPSLSVLDAGDRVLIHCFAGCEPERILAAVGLTWRDLFDDDWKAALAQARATPVRLPPLDPLDLERLILEVAAADLRAGKELNIEDRARVQLARERVKVAA